MKYLMLGGFFISTMLVGCSSFYPVPVDERNIVARLNKQDTEYGLPVADSLDKAVENLDIYARWYIFKANELKTLHQGFGDANLGFSLAGIAAGLAGMPKGAAEGMFLSSVSNVPKTRYQLEVQSINYEKASDAMSCLYRIAITNTGSLRVDFLNEKIDEVRKKLRDLQSSVVLAQPDMNKLESSIRSIIIPDVRLLSLESELLSADETENDKERVRVEASLDKCVAEFSK